MGLPMTRTRAGLILTMAALLALLAAAVLLVNYRLSGRQVANDFEECQEKAETSSSEAERSANINQCGQRFAGRRKAGGGYAYYDFMQNRTFDIAGPNPNEEERKQIDRSYVEFLGTQRQEMLSSELAKRQSDQEQATLEQSRQAAVDAAPAVTEKIPLPVKRPPVERSRACEDGSLSCSWAKLSAAVKNAFASSSRTKP
jgi:hypothetical protein